MIARWVERTFTVRIDEGTYGAEVDDEEIAYLLRMGGLDALPVGGDEPKQQKDQQHGDDRGQEASVGAVPTGVIAEPPGEEQNEQDQQQGKDHERSSTRSIGLLDAGWALREAIRSHVATWIEQERREYADIKYADEGPNRAMLLNAMRRGELDTWTNFLGNYIRRAELLGLDNPAGRQAMGKAAVTALHILESACDLFGPMPAPGVPSGEIG